MIARRGVGLGIQAPAPKRILMTVVTWLFYNEGRGNPALTLSEMVAVSPACHTTVSQGRCLPGVSCRLVQ